MSASTSGGVLCGITLGARDWSNSPATPSSSNRLLNLLPVFREMPYSRHRSVRRSPVASLLMNSLRRSMGDFVFQGTGAPPAPGLAGRHPCALSVPSPMYLVCTQMRTSMVYVLLNFRKHLRAPACIDPRSSGQHFGGWQATPVATDVAPATVEPATWMARVGWRRAGGALRVDEPPAAPP